MVFLQDKNALKAKAKIVTAVYKQKYIQIFYYFSEICFLTNIILQLSLCYREETRLIVLSPVSK